MTPLPTCNPEHALCAKKMVGWKPASCTHCGLKKSVYQSAPLQVQDRAERSPPNPPSSDDSDAKHPGSPISPTGPDQSAIPHPETPTAPPRPSATPSSSSRRQRSEQQTVAARSKVLLRRHRRGLLIGASAVVAIFLTVNLASSILKRPDFESAFSNEGVDFKGRVDDRLLAIAPRDGQKVVIGSKDADLSDDQFEIRGAEPEATGLAYFEAGGVLLGLDLVPKSRELAEFETTISVESTAVSLVLLHPQMSEFHTLGNPVGDAALKMIVARTPSFTGLVRSLDAEIETDGINYLDRQSTTTESLIETVVNESRATINEFRQVRSSGGGFGQSVSPKFVDRKFAHQSSQRGSQSSAKIESAYPITCDYGLIPSSYGEADGLCVVLKSPDKENWDTFAFDADITIEVTNLAPRAVAVFTSPMQGERGSLLGFVPPLDVSVSSGELMAWALAEVKKVTVAGLTNYDLKDPESNSAKDRESSASAVTMTFRDPTRLGEISTVSVLGTPDQVINESLDERTFQQGRALSGVLTVLSSYIFPSLSVLLDKGEWATLPGTSKNVFDACPASVFTDLLGGTALNLASAFGDLRDGLSRSITTEIGVSEIFWFVFVRRYYHKNALSKPTVDTYTSECEKALAMAKILSACTPTLKSFLSASLIDCLSSDDELQALLVGSIQRVFVSVVNPFAKLDLALGASGVALTGIWTFSDTARFGNADVYRLETVSVPLWCYEVSRSRSRFVGAFPEIPEDGWRGMILALRQGLEQLTKFSDDEFWSSESERWNEISELEPPTNSFAAAQIADDAKLVSASFQAIAALMPTDSIIDKGKNVGKLFRDPKVLAKFTELDGPMERIDQVWQSCPQATRLNSGM